MRRILFLTVLASLAILMQTRCDAQEMYIGSDGRLYPGAPRAIIEAPLDVDEDISPRQNSRRQRSPAPGVKCGIYGCIEALH
jgi:hypothetical protein